MRVGLTVLQLLAIGQYGSFVKLSTCRQHDTGNNVIDFIIKALTLPQR